MKKSPISLEPLEARIAPATIINPNTITWLDTDGDLATLHLSKGIFTSQSVANSVLHFDTGAVNNDNTTGQQLLQIDLTAVGTAAAGTNITVSAVTKPGGNGFVDVGFIKAAIPDPANFQFSKGIDLGKITIAGDLGGIYAGDQYANAAIQSLNVHSFGALNAIEKTAQMNQTGATSGNDDGYIPVALTSEVLAPIKHINIATNFDGTYGASLKVLGAQFGNVGSLHIGGDLLGGSADNSGQIFFTHSLGTVTIDGSITGGTGLNSGALYGYENSTTHITKLTVSGDITGASGQSSGLVKATRLGSVTVDGSVLGYVDTTDPVNTTNGLGSGSIQGTFGTLHIVKNIVGGTGSTSGTIIGSGQSNVIKVDGNLSGGAGTNSGVIQLGGFFNSNFTYGSLNKLTIGGSIIGGAGDGSGTASSSSISHVEVNGFMTSGTGGSSGALAGGTMKSVTIGQSVTGQITGTSINNLHILGNVTGISADQTGYINLTGVLKNAVIEGNLTGGSTVDAATSLNQSGYIQAGVITNLTIQGDITAGSKTVTGSEANTNGTLTNSGAIRATTEITSLTVGGNITGNTDEQVVISAAGHTSSSAKTDVAIGKITVGSIKNNVTTGGNVSYANLLAGYAPANSATGTATDGDASIGTILVNGNLSGTNIAAGTSAGADGKFATTDDAVISSTDRTNLTATIASIIVKGSLRNTAGSDDSYGFAAQWIKSVQIGDSHRPLQPGKSNDTTPTAVVTGSDTNYLEVE
jgi:hypothetical protein